MDVKLKREIILDNYQNPANRGIPSDSSYKEVNWYIDDYCGMY